MDHGFRVGVFADMGQAKHAIDDVIAAGIRRDAIMVVLSEDQTEDAATEALAEQTIHPTKDTRRGLAGGAMGSAIGGFSGAFVMYLLVSGGTLPLMALWIGMFAGGLIGLYAGALIAWWGLRDIRNFLTFSKEWLWNRSAAYDNWRSMTAGALGGVMGSVVGTMASYALGVSTLWFFVTSGLYAAAMALFVGGLVGAMSGRGMSPRAIGNWEDLIDGENRILVSVDCNGAGEKMPLIEALLRTDGASRVKVA